MTVAMIRYQVVDIYLGLHTSAIEEQEIESNLVTKRYSAFSNDLCSAIDLEEKSGRCCSRRIVLCPLVHASRWSRYETSHADGMYGVSAKLL